MAGTHVKRFSNKEELTVLQLTNEKSRNMSVALKTVAISSMALLLIFSIIITLFFLEGVLHKEVLKDAKNIIKISGGMQNGLKVLSEENPDISCWLRLNGTAIDCAVCSAEDDYYKNHNQKRKLSRYGALYLSEGDLPQRTGGDRNLVIYGNNMPDGSMFGNLSEYRKLKFYKENPKIFFYFEDKKQLYFVFAVALVDGENPDFDYEKSSFASNKEFDEWYEKIKQRSIIDTTVAATQEDEFLTLVTDANDFDGARLVVMARLADEWDFVFNSLEDAKINADAIYPDKWYNR